MYWNSDLWVVLGAVMLILVSNFLLVRPQNPKIHLINVGVLLLYSCYFYIAPLYDDAGGVALVYWFYWLVILGVHWLIGVLGVSLMLWLSKRGE